MVKRLVIYLEVMGSNHAFDQKFWNYMRPHMLTSPSATWRLPGLPCGSLWLAGQMEYSMEYSFLINFLKIPKTKGYWANFVFGITFSYGDRFSNRLQRQNQEDELYPVVQVPISSEHFYFWPFYDTWSSAPDHYWSFCLIHSSRNADVLVTFSIHRIRGWC